MSPSPQGDPPRPRGAAVDDRRHAIALFRYSPIREAADPALSPRQRGTLVRALAERDHIGPDGQRVRLTRQTFDRWICDWRAGGFQALLPRHHTQGMRTAEVLLNLAVELKREAPRRTAAQIAAIIAESRGDAPSGRTLARYFRRLGLDRAGNDQPPRAFGRFEAAAPTTCGPATRCTARRSPAARPTCSPSSTTTAERWSATASAWPKTPSGWRQRCAPRWPPVGSPRCSTSTTARHSPASSSSGPARSWASAWPTPNPASRPAGARSSGCLARCAASSSSSSTRVAAPATWPS